jgi:lipid II:glycine glycyltransferase (peptidoglycan interpeptide bridge formation enzyme)
VSGLQHVEDADTWDRLVTTLPHASPLQSWAWGELKARYGWRPARLMWSVDGRPAGAVATLRRALPAGLALHYAPRGPLLAQPRLETLRSLLLAIRPAFDRGTVALKLDPEWEEEQGWRPATLRAAGLRHNPHDIQHRSTYLVDLRGSESEVLGRLKPVTRYNIRYAARHGITVRDGTDAASFSCFFALLQESARRNRFQIRAPGYYRDLLELFAARQQARIFIAERDGVVLSAILTVTYGAGLYYFFGGSNLQERAFKPNYLLHWEAMRDARRRGCTTYDMWGIPLEPRPDHPGHGYYVFKTKFNGCARRFVGMWEWPLRPLAYRAVRVAERWLTRGRPDFV